MIKDCMEFEGELNLYVEAFKNGIVLYTTVNKNGRIQTFAQKTCWVML